MKYPVPVLIAFDAFRDKHEIRVVGGCVRDVLSNRAPKDWDMCTTANPEETFKILDDAGLRPYDISNGHGTICFDYEGGVIEITTLRVDEKTDGRHAQVRFVNDFKLDAARRDFTINAMSMDRDYKVYDYFMGQSDLMHSQIQFVGNPNERIKEDYLRILRFYRFVGRFSSFDKIDRKTATAIFNNRNGLKQISGERIWMEMQQIFGMNDANLLFTMKANGIIDTLGFKLKDGI